MDYQFENLGPERFQEFCQALLVKENLDVQCFPVAQPDGGRDAIIYSLSGRTTKAFIVFQVKFVRRPHAEADPHKWLINIIEEEAPKVKQLIEKGAVKYYLLTNVPGTAHLDRGSIDKANKILNNVLEIPFQCWWRDDLSRHLDNAWNLKWVYPELMTGLDMLRHLFEEGLSEHQERRITAIKTFVRSQFDIDQEVRFKQIELQNKLLDLFIDVPLRHTSSKEDRKYAFMMHLIAQEQIGTKDIDIRQAFRTDWEEELRTLGAATMLLHPLVQEHIPQVVLEGAPGQGKSTIAQYICQVYRMHILKEISDLEVVPKHLKPTSMRIPFKVDLRDLATWLDRQDPFSSDENKMPPQGWQKSLESFLAFQIQTLSGGIEFSVMDLHAVAKLSAFLLVLDGLDEVADISRRKEIVSVVKAGVNNLKLSCASLQVVITSRPAAFVNSPGFPEITYPRFELISITKPLIEEYANKWSKAQKLNSRDIHDVKQILKEKLDQPHLRELARNTMQLAILLSLIHARGSSLPDKRTALYDSYVQLFFSRESDKSLVVREYRDLLLDIHMYLAWILHSEAEQGHNRGSISSERLHNLLSEYLIEEGYDSSITDKLFTGMVERVVALVSRVQGTYEFEVQPLREYFAARCLYETAPYSPPGAERKGTKPDRFDAIARDFYWLNVTRFYAGCFSKGELPALVDSLEVLAQAEGYRNISHPRNLAAMLLSDWVFTQNQRSMKGVIKLILDGLGLRSILVSKNRSQISDSTLVVPKGCGHDELMEQCFSILSAQPAQDYAHELIELIKVNADVDEIKPMWWKVISNTTGLERTQWLGYGFHLGILRDVTIKEIEALISDDVNNPLRLNYLFRSKHFNFCEASVTRCSVIVDSILNRDFIIHYNVRLNRTIINLFARSLDLSVYRFIFRESEHSSLLQAIWRHYPTGARVEEILDDLIPSSPILKKCLDTFKIITKEQTHSIKKWKSELAPWDTMVEELRSIWGDRWILFNIANISCSIHVSKEVYEDFPELLDHSKSLCRRTQYARSKFRSSDWWRTQFTTATTELDYMFISLIFLTWASSSVIVNLSKEVDEIFKTISMKNWHFVVRSAQEAIQGFRNHTPNSLLSLDIDGLPNSLSPRTLAAIGIRTKQEQTKKIYLKHLSNYQGSDSTVLKFCQEVVLNLTRDDPLYWQQALTIIAKNYAQGFIVDAFTFRPFTKEPSDDTFPLEIALEVTNQPQKYPRYLVTFAAAMCKQFVATKIIPVGEIAQKDNWFGSPT